MKFIIPRGNIEKEIRGFFNPADAEMQGIDAWKLKSTFERVMKKIHRKDQEIYIYCLIDPITFEVKYVGKSNDPEHRYRAHVSDFRPNKHAGNGAKCLWIKELLKKGHKPILDILFKCTEPESENYEYRYFKLFNYGNNLLNSATIQKETFQYQLKL